MKRIDSKIRRNAKMFEDNLMDSIRREKKKVPSDDTILRYKIHKTIQMLGHTGTPKVEILKTLHNQFPDTKLSIYFERWIDDLYPNKEKDHSKKGNDHDDEQR